MKVKGGFFQRYNEITEKKNTLDNCCMILITKDIKEYMLNAIIILKNFIMILKNMKKICKHYFFL